MAQALFESAVAGSVALVVTVSIVLGWSFGVLPGGDGLDAEKTGHHNRAGRHQGTLTPVGVRLVLVGVQWALGAFRLTCNALISGS